MQAQTTAPDYDDVRKWFRAAPSDPDGIWHSFPMEDVTCGACGTEGCLMYPASGEDNGAPQEHRPSTVCPQCSTASVESYLRYAAEHKGYTLKSVSVFGALRAAPVQDMQDMLDRGTPEQRAECVAALAECWGAAENGSDWTNDFELGDDGRIGFRVGRPPSFALALLFDHGRFLRGESTVMEWVEAEHKAAA